jgi:rod shape-determining protein MreC
VRKVLQLIRRFWNLILFITLEIISLTLIAKRNSLQGVDIINSSNAIVGYLYEKQNNVVYYFRLKQMNDSLLQENTRIRNELAQWTGVDTFSDSLVRIPPRTNDSGQVIKTGSSDSSRKPLGKPSVVQYATYHYIPARVINNSIANDRMNYITLNRGTKAGIRPNMVVVSNNGIVGRVAHVSENFSTVVSLLSEGRSYSAELADGTTGFMLWEKGSPDYIQLTKIPLEQKVKTGDSVFTATYSIFPANIVVGTVAGIDTVKANNTKTLKVRLTTNFRKLQYVYVVYNEYATEQQGLEAKNEKSE